MKFASLALNLCLGLTAIFNLLLGVWTVNLQRDGNKNVFVNEFTNGFEVHRGAHLQPGDALSRSGDYLRLEDIRTNGWFRIAHITCPPSSLSPTTTNTIYGTTDAVGMPSEQTLQRASKAFDNCPYERVVEVGNQAKAFISSILTKGNYRLVTRWIINEQDKCFYGYLLVRQEDGTERSLHEILLERGLAYPAVTSFPDPTGLSFDEVRQRASAAFEKARAAKVGGFKHSLDDRNFRPSRYTGRDIAGDFDRMRRSVANEQRIRSLEASLTDRAPANRPLDPTAAAHAEDGALNTDVSAELQAAEAALREAEASLRAAEADQIPAESESDADSADDDASTEPAAVEADAVEADSVEATP